MIWKKNMTLPQLNETSRDNLAEHLGIEFVELGKDYLKARMPVDNRTRQPEGRLHGGASVALAETVGSISAWMCVDSETKTVVGLEINANHIRSISGGFVTAESRPLHLGKTTQIWEIKILNEENKLVCVSRLTVANIDSPRHILQQ